MKTWIHQIKSSMQWQKQNAELKLAEYEADPTDLNLQAYITSFGLFKKLEGRYEQWHIDAKEVEAGTF